ncbi:ABC transporter ATP-binding protein [Paenibacillus sp. GXUN7292]|uniref:ABC transporter ATP-binding protein n=1 Tax=Paenibacillus sp. GXUN7292 TaxID=3422499 RepID=UPI003D7E31A7
MEINNISFSYSGKIKTLHDVTGSIELGKVTTIIGPNGSGKSTLLDIMSNHAVPDAGQVTLDGKVLTDFRPKELARRLAIVHQHNSAPADLTVEKLVSYGRIPHRQMFAQQSEQDAEAVEQALARTNLLGKRKASIAALSGGEKQRVWIAVALAQSTPYLFLDEPTTYLDIYYQYEVLELVKSLNEQHGMTIVMVLHDMNQSIRYSDCIIAMKNGRILAMGAPQDVITAETVKSLYGVEVIIKNDADAGMYMVPIGLS